MAPGQRAPLLSVAEPSVGALVGASAEASARASVGASVGASGVGSVVGSVEARRSGPEKELATGHRLVAGVGSGLDNSGRRPYHCHVDHTFPSWCLHPHHSKVLQCMLSSWNTTLWFQDSGRTADWLERT